MAPTSRKVNKQGLLSSRWGAPAIGRCYSQGDSPYVQGYELDASLSMNNPYGPPHSGGPTFANTKMRPSRFSLGLGQGLFPVDAAPSPRENL